MGLVGGYDLKRSGEVLETVSSSSKQQMDRFSYYDECRDELDNNNAYFSFSSGEDSESDIGSDFEDVDRLDADDSDPCSSSGEDSELDIGSDFEVHKSPKVGNSIVDFTEAVNTEYLRAAFENLTEKTASSSDYNRNEKISATQDVCSFQPISLTKRKAERKGHVIGPLHVLPLYAKLHEAAQLRVFEKTKEGERLVVVATNVAETSLTIPGIRYVVDTGREKVKEYNPSNGMESYEIKWISKASASQRAGRAGRTGPDGHCYCLYSSAAFTNLFPDFSTPEILKTPLDYVVLLLKSMGIREVANFPFPTPPDAEEIGKAQMRLMYLEAFDSKCRVTPMGKAMAQYPISPRHSRLLLHAIQLKKTRGSVRPNLVLGYAVAVAAALSVDNPYSFNYEGSQANSEGQEQEDDSGFCGRQKTRESANCCSAKFANLKSDALTVAYTLQLFEQSENQTEFCKGNTLHFKIMVEMSELRKQLLNIVFEERDHRLQTEFSWSHGTIKDVEDYWAAPCDKCPLWQEEEDILCEAVCAGWIDMVAKRTRRGASVSSEGGRKVNAICYQVSSLAETVFFGRWSSISKAAPEFLVYNELICTKRPYIHRATSVKPEWLAKLSGPLLCKYSAPLTDPKPFYDPHCDQVFNYVIPYFGRHLWELPRHRVPIEDVERHTIVFAYALLDGQVLPCLKSVKKLLISPPSSILKPEALGQKRMCNLISKLRSRRIDSFAKLKEAWKEDSQLLYLELLEFFQKDSRSLFYKLWEIMLQEAFPVPQVSLLHRTRKRKCSIRE